MFAGWYSDEDCTVLISIDNPYTLTVMDDITLYAKAVKKQLSMTVGISEHGYASISSNVVSYGDAVTFVFTPEDDTWELYGWYSDAGLTQLVSEANPYNFSATEDTTLYPKVGKKRYMITFGGKNTRLYWVSVNVEAVAIYYDELTKDELSCLRSGEPLWIYQNTKTLLQTEITLLMPLQVKGLFFTNVTQQKTMNALTEAYVILP